MVKRHFDLFDDFANFAALDVAATRAARGKRGKASVARFLANREREVVALCDALHNGSWQPGRYRVMQLTDPKPRMISAAPFRDRVLHHALCDVVAPIFERGFTDDSFANRIGFGTHRAIARYERYRDRYAWVLRCDIWRYFPAIDHDALKWDLRRRIGCPRTLDVLDKIVDSANAQEPVNLYFKGDDLFSPFARRRGLPIGNLTSQLFGNVYLNAMDHFIREVLRIPGYVRYVDDFALFSNDRAKLEDCRNCLDAWLDGRRLRLHPHKTRLEASCLPTEFLGMVLMPQGRRLPAANVTRFRSRLRGLRDRWQAGTIVEDEVRRRVGAWLAHAAHADTQALRATLFRSGWFSPPKLEGRAAGS